MQDDGRLDMRLIVRTDAPISKRADRLPEESFTDIFIGYSFRAPRAWLNVDNADADGREKVAWAAMPSLIERCHHRLSDYAREYARRRRSPHARPDGINYQPSFIRGIRDSYLPLLALHYALRCQRAGRDAGQYLASDAAAIGLPDEAPRARLL